MKIFGCIVAISGLLYSCNPPAVEGKYLHYRKDDLHPDNEYLYQFVDSSRLTNGLVFISSPKAPKPCLGNYQVVDHATLTLNGCENTGADYTLTLKVNRNSANQIISLESLTDLYKRIQ